MNNEGEMLNVRPYTPDENGVNFDEQQLFVVRRRDMSFVSDYFRRDARRYDNGFELTESAIELLRQHPERFACIGDPYDDSWIDEDSPA